MRKAVLPGRVQQEAVQGVARLTVYPNFPSCDPRPTSTTPSAHTARQLICHGRAKGHSRASPGQHEPGPNEALLQLPRATATRTGFGMPHSPHRAQRRAKGPLFPKEKRTNGPWRALGTPWSGHTLFTGAQKVIWRVPLHVPFPSPPPSNVLHRQQGPGATWAKTV